MHITKSGVRDAYRKLVKRRYEYKRHYRGIYRRGRYKVEQSFGNVKVAWATEVGRGYTSLRGFLYS